MRSGQSAFSIIALRTRLAGRLRIQSGSHRNRATVPFGLFVRLSKKPMHREARMGGEDAVLPGVMIIRLARKNLNHRARGARLETRKELNPGGLFGKEIFATSVIDPRGNAASPWGWHSFSEQATAISRFRNPEERWLALTARNSVKWWLPLKADTQSPIWPVPFWSSGIVIVKQACRAVSQHW